VDILKKARILMRMKGMGPSMGVLAISIAFAVGTYVSNHTDVKDGPLEQTAEMVLDMYGIDYDFTPDEVTK